jgi:hypothetical protein
MSLIKQTKIITINSSDGTTQGNQSAGYLSDLNFDFKQVIQDEKNIAYNTISLHSVDITNSFYNLNALNNKIDVKITIVANGSEITTSINIPIGNYSASSFVSQFNTLFLAITNKAGILAININNGLFSLSPDTPHYTITILPTSTAYDILGLSPNSTPVFIYGNPNVFNKGCNFLGITQLNIFSKALASDNLDSKSLTQNNIIAVIPITAPSYSLITYDNRNEESVLINKDIGSIDLQIKDSRGVLANFNFIDWSITFTINTFRIIEIDKILTTTEFKDLLNVKKEGSISTTENNTNKKTKRSFGTTKKSLPKGDKTLDILLS